MIQNISCQVFKALIVLFLVTSCQNAINSKPYKSTANLSVQEKLDKLKGFNFSSRESQIKHGNKLALDIIEKYEQEGKKLNENINKVQYQRLVNIFNRLHKISYLSNENWNVVMLPDNEINAYSTFGTVIFINYGLAEAIKFDDEIASILANKLANVTARNYPSPARQGLNELDRLAILYTSLAGYDPNAYSRIWQKIFEKQGENNSFVEEQRIVTSKFYKMQLIAQKAKQYLVPGKINPNYSYILKNNSIYQTYNEDADAIPKSLNNLNSYNNDEGYKNNYLEENDIEKLNQNNELNITALKEIESKMQVKGADKKPNGDIVLKVKYAGTKPINNLAIKAVTEQGQSIYHHGSVIGPNQVFNANFSADALGMDGNSRPKMKLVVDEANYLN